MHKQPEVTDATRKCLIDTFFSLYRENPIEKITVKKITELSGYNRSTFYVYFQDVYDLLEYSENQLVNHICTILMDTPAEEAMFTTNFFRTFTEIINTHSYFSVIIQKSSERSSFTSKMSEQLTELFLLKYHVSKDEREIFYALNFHISGMIALLGLWFNDQNKISVESLGDMINTYLHKGLFTLLQIHGIKV